MYAPVVSRFRTYGPLDLPKPAADWAAMLWKTRAMQEWGRGAEEEVRAAK
jgi:hypothetical protein